MRKTGCGRDENCVWSVEDDSTLCQVLASEARLGDPCRADVPSCAAGLTCTALRDDETTTCYAVCDPEADLSCREYETPNRAFVCMPLSNLTHGLCVAQGSTCNPLEPSTCGDEETCSFFGGQTSCVRAGDLEAGDDCSAALCGRGLVCTKLQDRRTPVCMKPCDPGSPSCGATGEVCTGLEGLSFGVCQPTTEECSPLTERCGQGRICGLQGTKAACIPVGTVALGESCATSLRAQGGVCVRMLGEPNHLCREPCDLGLSLCGRGTEECFDIGLGFGICR